MNNKLVGTAAAAAALALALAGCATNEAAGPGTAPTSASLSGNLQGTGASSMGAAQEAWIAAFQTANTGVRINYSPEGSGNGRTAFINGGADFAGSDRALKDDEMGAGKFATCAADSNALNLPVYISPIAVIFNVAGVSSLNLDGETVAGIFAGTITRWNDPRITTLNPGVSLPDATISTVHRSDNSGTTENFTDTLHQLAPSVWTTAASGDWPTTLAGEAAKGTSGVVSAVTNGVNTIGYADESQVGDLSTVKYGKAGGSFVGPTADAAAQVVEASTRVAGRADNDWALTLNRSASGYPFVLLSYAIACEQYKDAAQGELVKAYLGYIASPAGQAEAAAKAGSAPLSSTLSDGVAKAISSIK